MYHHLSSGIQWFSKVAHAFPFCLKWWGASARRYLQQQELKMMSVTGTYPGTRETSSLGSWSEDPKELNKLLEVFWGAAAPLWFGEHLLKSFSSLCLDVKTTNKPRLFPSPWYAKSHPPFEHCQFLRHLHTFTTKNHCLSWCYIFLWHGMLHNTKSLVFLDAKSSSHYVISCGSFLCTGIRLIQSIPVCNSGQVASYTLLLNS